MLQISWQALAAILTLIPLAGGIFHRTLAMRFRAELAEFRNALMDDMGERYMLRVDGERRMDILAAELKETRHDLRNQLQALTARLEQWQWSQERSK